MEIVIKVSDKSLKFIATDMVNDLFEEFGKDVCEFAGVYKDELVEGILESYEFSKHVEKKVMNYGPDFVDCPYDYDNYMFDLDPLAKHIEAFQTIWIDAEQSERNGITQESLNAALHIVKKAGYKVI